jgi:hypothetical protein
MDACVRFRVLRLYSRLNQHSNLNFLGDIVVRADFP